MIGFQEQGPCNGPVFSDAVPFTGSGLDGLGSPTTFTRSYTDAATHDTGRCGDIAETDVVFSVWRVPFVSVKQSVMDRFPPRYPGQYGPGRRQYGKPGTTVSIKSVLGVLP